MNKLPNYEDLCKLTAILINEGYDSLEVTFKTDTIERLNKVNDEFFYKTIGKKEKDDDGKEIKKTENPEEVSVTFNNIKYKYIV